jgi:hypothetical protein
VSDLVASIGAHPFPAAASPDLKHRFGESMATPSQIWGQPPGTPTIGSAFLRAFAVTGDRRYLEAAREAAYALVRGQLRSGGTGRPRAAPSW